MLFRKAAISFLPVRSIVDNLLVFCSITALDNKQNTANCCLHPQIDRSAASSLSWWQLLLDLCLHFGICRNSQVQVENLCHLFEAQLI